MVAKYPCANSKNDLFIEFRTKPRKDSTIFPYLIGLLINFNSAIKTRGKSIASSY